MNVRAVSHTLVARMKQLEHFMIFKSIGGVFERIVSSFKNEVHVKGAVSYSTESALFDVRKEWGCLP